jgi:hypothetical protein
VISDKPQEIWEMMSKDMKHKGVDQVISKNLILEDVIKRRNKDRSEVQKLMAQKGSVLTARRY